MLGELVSLTFGKNRMTPHSVFTYQALRYSIVYVDKNCQAAIIFFINLDLPRLSRDMK